MCEAKTEFDRILFDRSSDGYSATAAVTPATADNTVVDVFSLYLSRLILRGVNDTSLKITHIF